MFNHTGPLQRILIIYYFLPFDLVRVLPLALVGRLLFFLFFFLGSFGLSAQDSAQDSLPVMADTAVADTAQQIVAPPPARPAYGTARKARATNLYFFIGLGTFLLLGLLRFLYSKYITELLTILSRSTLGRMTSKEAIWQSSMPRLLFLFIYFLSTGYIIGRLIRQFSSLQADSFSFWVWGVLVIVSASLLKFLATHAVALIFQMTKTVKTFFDHISVVNQLLGVIFLPICGILMMVSASVGNMLVILSGVILLLALSFKFLINIGYVRNLPKVRFLYFILYLCTFEFIPLAVFARYVYNTVGA